MGCLGEWPEFVPMCFLIVTGGETFRLETNVWVLWEEIKAENRMKERWGWKWYLTNIRPIHSTLKSELVLWANHANKVDEKWRVLQATLVQALLPHLTFSPEITWKPFFVCLNAVYFQYVACLLGIYKGMTWHLLLILRPLRVALIMHQGWTFSTLTGGYTKSLRPFKVFLCTTLVFELLPKRCL